MHVNGFEFELPVQNRDNDRSHSAARVWAVMACRSGEMAAPRVAQLAALLAAILVTVTSRAPTQEPVQFEAAFQGITVITISFYEPHTHTQRERQTHSDTHP
ncbi:unnamed protein product [Diatraea saccharalis]|uniref:Uncharacterized protein n=1 Tax=Diatraea saccharalis TaxID=40085 RepID=A0A9N9WIT3_9NEOP|nr:unnamed protein product [Diatraea saccharalis]